MNDSHDKTSRSANRRPLRAKLIFNPGAGERSAAPGDLLGVVHAMQAWKLVPEVFLVEEGCDLPGAVRRALAQDIRLFVVCGGDGTISAVAGLLADTPATLGIIPNGTQNNVALSLGIPTELAAAMAILRTGRRIKVDVGMAICANASTPFLEVCSTGLVSTLFPSADDLQHGNLARAGDFLTTLVTSPPAEIHLVLDDKREVRSQGYVVLVSNMPYIGRHYQVGGPTAFKDGLLDVLFFADLSKLDLLAYLLQGADAGESKDPRIQRYRVRRVEIDTQPAMPIMADGQPLGEGQVRIQVRRRALTVMVGKPAPKTRPDPDVIDKAEAHAAAE